MSSINLVLIHRIADSILREQMLYAFVADVMHCRGHITCISAKRLTDSLISLWIGGFAVFFSDDRRKT